MAITTTHRPIPATTDKRCRDYATYVDTQTGAKFCKCIDFKERQGGSYYDARFGDICKHCAHLIAQSDERDALTRQILALQQLPAEGVHQAIAQAESEQRCRQAIGSLFGPAAAAGDIVISYVLPRQALPNLG